MRSWILGFGSMAFVGLVVSAAACGSDSSNTPSTGAGDDGGDVDAFNPSFGDGSIAFDGSLLACEETCPNNLICDHGFCEPPQGGCTKNGDCNFDTYCEKDGTCVPYGSLPDNAVNDPTCKLAVPPGAFAPKTFCEFVPPTGDPFATYVDVQATPIVVNFNQGALQSGPPSIVVPFTVPVSGVYTEDKGVLRILRGSDCGLEANIGNGQVIADFIRSSSPVAVGDLDGDGAADIVAFLGDDSLAAFTRKAGQWKTLWATKKATLQDGVTIFTREFTTIPGNIGNWAGPSIHDLDDDGRPEIIVEGYVIGGQDGKLRAGVPANYATYAYGLPPVLANLDADAKIELTNGAHVWEFDGANNVWNEETYYSQVTPSNPGWTALADFNPYDGKKTAEIAVATTGTITVYNVDHSVFMGLSLLAVPGTGGGPPTVADYDGDGLPEIGLAGSDFYTVFDPDCQATPRTNGKCADRTHCDYVAGGGCPDFILWSRKTQDHSSDVTGSSVFDFDADGRAEVVYADECFARVYGGPNGDVLFSQYHSSCTWLENPVVADVDGDFRAELVVPSNTACGTPGVGIACAQDAVDTDGGIVVGSLDVNNVDKTFVGTQCQKGTDCVSGNCDSGYCRCVASADCCAAKNDAKCIEQGSQCAPPPVGTAGTGNTCRAPHPHGVQGIRVYKDAADRWVRSRTIWNQHAYAVTHVNEDGTIPKTSAWMDNWTSPGLNNFRQNVPGEGDGTAIGDLTAQSAPNFSCAGGNATLIAPVCNRGTAPVGANIPVGFYTTTPNGSKTLVCTSKTPAPIPIGQCVNVTCVWKTPPTNTLVAIDVTVVANDGNTTQECDTTNDDGLVDHVYCTPPK